MKGLMRFARLHGGIMHERDIPLSQSCLYDLSMDTENAAFTETI